MTAKCPGIRTILNICPEMNWLYKQSDREMGPVSASTLDKLTDLKKE